MERIKVTQNFYLDEFVDPYTFLNETDHGLSKIDSRLFTIAQTLRDLYGKPIRINSWWWYYIKYKGFKTNSKIIRGIERSKTISKWSGIRTERCKIGAKYSAHRTIHNGKGRAIDPKGDQKEFYNILENNTKLFYDLGVRRIEHIFLTNGWMHIDTLERNTIADHINVVDLSKITKRIIVA